MLDKDLLFQDEKSIFNFRSAGVLIRDNKFLVQRERNGAEYALPGGHVKFGETSAEALVREFKEETGADILCGRLIWVEECFWNWGNKKAHTLVYYHLVSLENSFDIPSDHFASQKDNCGVVLEWASFEKIQRLKIYPYFIKDKIGNISQEIEHFVSYD